MCPPINLPGFIFAKSETKHYKCLTVQTVTFGSYTQQMTEILQVHQSVTCGRARSATVQDRDDNKKTTDGTERIEEEIASDLQQVVTGKVYGHTCNSRLATSASCLL